MITSTTLKPQWSQFEKIGFRFSFIYFALYIIIQNNGAYPIWGALMNYPTELLHKFIPWIGKNILNLSYEITEFTGGSGDTTYDYVTVLVILVVAVFGSILWSILDRNRINYTKIYYWLTVAMRLYVGLMLVNYGLVKVVKLQFPDPSFYRLLEPYGESSPMGLAWTFLGFSKGYNMFMGIAEVLAVLLLFRRTLTLGLIITLMTTANVMAVNYFYDVPVKLLSTHLVLMTLFLLSRDFGTLFKFFLTNKVTSLTIIRQPQIPNDKSLRLISRILKGLLLSYIVIFGAIRLMQSQKTYGAKAPKPALYGLYEVIHFEKNGDTLPANLNDSEHWRYIAMEREGSATVYKMNNERVAYQSVVDTLKHEIEFTDYYDSTDFFTLKYDKTNYVFSFETIRKNDTIKARCKIKTKEDFLLMNRGFHWISEQPYNR